MRHYLWLGLIAGLGCGPSRPAGPFDLVVANGRVIDPESGLDAVRWIGIHGDQITAVSDRPLTARETIDAKGLVVSPGFIDLHSHSVGADGQRWQVRDGVTSAFELEEGAYPVAEWLARLKGRSVINYGVSAGHIPARVAVLEGARALDSNQALRLAGNTGVPPKWSHHSASDAELDQLERALIEGLEAGGLGIGFELNESPGASRAEVLRLFRLAARYRVPIYAHLRFMGVDPVAGSLAGAQEVLTDALVTGASLHFVHLGSSGSIYARQLVEMIAAAQQRGLDVSGEVYPYTAASTGIETALFEGDWQGRMGISYDGLEWPATGERLTASSFARYRRQGGAVIIHFMKDDNVDYLVGTPGVMIASDAMPLPNGKGHPRGVGTFARVLGRYHREKQVIGLAEAIRKMTLLPAERVAGAAPEMSRRGRIKVGAFADLTIFDSAAVIDHATFANPTQASTGIPWVVVGGTVVVRNGELVPAVAPGRPITRAGH